MFLQLSYDRSLFFFSISAVSWQKSSFFIPKLHNSIRRNNISQLLFSKHQLSSSDLFRQWHSRRIAIISQAVLTILVIHKKSLCFCIHAKLSSSKQYMTIFLYCPWLACMLVLCSCPFCGTLKIQKICCSSQSLTQNAFVNWLENNLIKKERDET